MGLSGFQIRPVSGPEIADFWGLNGPGKAFKHVGVLRPHRFAGFPVPPGPARPQKHTPKVRPDCLQVTNLVSLSLNLKITILVLSVLDRFPAGLGPGTLSNGSGSTNAVERT